MKPYFRIFVGLLIIWFGFKAIEQAYAGYYVGLLSEFQYVAFLLLILSTIIALLLDRGSYHDNPRLHQFAISFIGSICTIIVIFKIVQHNSIDNSKTVLQISSSSDNTNLRFQFKLNDNLRVIEYDRLGQTIYYGRYSKTKDTLNIISSNYSGYAKQLPKTGLIKGDSIFWNKFETMLIDKSGVKH